MVSEQIERRGIHDGRVLEAMRRVPRHLFVPPDWVNCAYQDRPLPIPHGQTISQPYIVALMTSLLHLQGGENVLEVGTGSGYQAAILSCIAGQVLTIEYDADLADSARLRLENLGFDNVIVCCGDGSLGLPEKAPFHGILVTAASPGAPDPLLEQLAVNAALVIPVGRRHGQDLQVWKRYPDRYLKKNIAPVAFVPLRGQWGWRDDHDWF
jgi:protein-L-isoaspartate(D-aspartate) O-methyltransferase